MAELNINPGTRLQLCFAPEPGKSPEFDMSASYFKTIDATTHFHYVQLNDFIEALRTGGKPLISLEDARRTVELFTAIYRSQRDKKPIRFPLEPEYGTDFDGRLG